MAKRTHVSASSSWDFEICLSEEMVWPGRLHFNHQSFFIASMVQLWMDGVWVYGLMHV